MERTIVLLISSRRKETTRPIMQQSESHESIRAWITSATPMKSRGLNKLATTTTTHHSQLIEEKTRDLPRRAAAAAAAVSFSIGWLLSNREMIEFRSSLTTVIDGTSKREALSRVESQLNSWKKGKRKKIRKSFLFSLWKTRSFSP